MTSLSDWLDRIGVEHPRGVRRGLEHVRDVAERLDVLPPAPCCIVVAGTNGKGSTAAFVESLLLAAGRTVGTTTSPHLHRFNERIRINGREADDANIVAAFEAVEACRQGAGLSYFEYAILAALKVITEAGVDHAVLEIGLGGRLDAVNVVDADVAVITSIGLDHQDYLGATRELIGAEKAGILRSGIPLVYGERVPPRSVTARAHDLDVPVYLAGRDFGHVGRSLWFRDRDQRGSLELPESAVDPVNAATAVQVTRLSGCPLDQSAVAAAAGRVRNPGRFEVVRRDDRVWVFDVAHNPDGAEFLAGQLRERFAGRIAGAVVGCLEDKDVKSIVAPLVPLVGEFVYADTVGARGAKGTALRAAVDDRRALAGTLAEATEHLVAATAPGDVILVLGSFDVVERARARFGLDGNR
ncbi:MAG: bifunctional folylpolyglutamate synthase/dihydrofolate synthase [Gammaproteobacteria bacterium]|nr:bifunctional folylpolyglutamate synthase/dihydrofolate synthase [Gammaproteobacteria bacterium]